MPRGSDLPIWNFFERCSEGYKTAVCNYCRRKMSFQSTITNLKVHLRKKHISAYNDFLNYAKTCSVYVSVPESTESNIPCENEGLHEENSGGGDNHHHRQNSPPHSDTARRGTHRINYNRISKTPRGSDLPIWNFFERCSEGYKTAVCNYCRRKMSFKSTITNLKVHLRKKHISAYNDFLNYAKTCSEYVSEPESTESNIPCENEGLHEENSGGGDNHHQRQNSPPYSDTARRGTHRINYNRISKTPRGSDLPIWNFFERCSEGYKRAVCNYCRRKISFKSTITNLKSHLKQKHISVYNKYLNLAKASVSVPKSIVSNISCKKEDLQEENSGGGGGCTGEDGNSESATTCISGGETGRHSRIATNINYGNIKEPPPKKVQRVIQTVLRKNPKPEEKANIDLSLSKMIVYDFQPFSIVNDVGFRAYTQSLNPNYKIPDLKTLSVNILPKMYEKRLKEMKTFVQLNAKSVCITVDSWSSRNMNSYMGLTAHFMTEDPIALKSVFIQCAEFDSHHTGIQMYREIKKILEAWGIYDKVNFFVTDNASNMENAARYLEEDGWSHFGCFAHKLNLVVQDALGEIKDKLDKVQRIVNHFKKSKIAKQKLLKYQRNQQNVTQPKMVIKSVPTRWNSVYLMLVRFVELEESLQATIPNLGTDLPIIPKEEWKCFEQICIILKPFYEATVEMSAENYLVASKAIVLTSSLIKICENYTRLQELLTPVKKLAQKLKDGMKNRLGEIEKNEAIGLSTVLDPRFKMKAIKNEEQNERLLYTLIEKITDEINNTIKPSENEEPVPSTSAASFISSYKSEIECDSDMPSYSLWCEFDAETNNDCDTKPPEVEAAEEVQKYLAENLIKRTECPFKYWREHKFIYPQLYKLFTKHCNIVATSVPCERIFSKSGIIINNRRKRLSTTKIAQIMFLNVNKI